MSDSISVYIHVPFCLKKCSYCDFYSTHRLSFLPAYVKSLQQEIEIRAGRPNGPDTQNRPAGPCQAPKKARTIYFGGGTPSLLSLEEVETILKTVFSCYRVSANAEITVEVNPGTVDEPYLAGLKKLGVNRLSIGVQSFDAGKIKVLNRIHTIEQSIETIGFAKAVGFKNIGLDLIYGTPGETRERWMHDLKTAAGFKAAHLSCYMLTLEPGTPLQLQYEKRLLHLPGPDSLADFFMATATFLGQQGYDHYEISNFARGKENRSRHNSAYWQMTPYDGFGPSAHSFGFLTEQGRDPFLASPVRSWNPADVKAYIRALSSGQGLVREREVLSLEQQLLERVMLGLRTSDGLDMAAIEKMSGQGFLKAIAPLLARLESQGLGAFLPGPGTKFYLTLAGRARLDSIVEAFADTIA